jgi:hypothetical protein
MGAAASVQVYPTPWILGKLGASVYQKIRNGKHTGYVFAYKSDSKYFSFWAFGGEAGAHKAAKEYQIRYNKEHNLGRNNYRFIDEKTCEGEVFHGPSKTMFTMLFDACNLELFLTHAWWVQKTGNNYYVYGIEKDTKRDMLFHREAMGVSPGEVDEAGDLVDVDHINGEFMFNTSTLDNRTSNLRRANSFIQSNNLCLSINNTSGYNGISPCTYGWRVCWRENNKQLSERFRSKEEAVKFRKRKDEAKGCTNGRPRASIKQIIRDNAEPLNKKQKTIQEFMNID